MSCDSLAEALDWRHERVLVISDEEVGLQAVVAIHSTALGPALGGLRHWAYERGLVDAVEDALRLSRAMTLKAAAAGLDLGGGKAVMLDDGRPELRTRRLERFALELERLDGAYITAEDVGTTTEDMDFLASHASHVVGRSARSGIGGDPSPDTARTVLHAIRAALSVLDEADGLDGSVVGILGLGKVGGPLATSLLERGAAVVGYDPAVRDLDGVELVDSQEALLQRQLDVLAPCALGGLIDAERAGRLRCRIVCGAANNPVTGLDAAAALAVRGVLYVPDFLANCGGLVHADGERRQASGEEVARKLDEAADRTRAILDEAVALGELPLTVAERHAAARIEMGLRRGSVGGVDESAGAVAT